MAELDPLIHAPARLQLLTTLSAVSEAEFSTLRDALEVSDSVLSKHISALADAGYVRSRKGGLCLGRCPRSNRGTAPADRRGRLIPTPRPEVFAHQDPLDRVATRSRPTSLGSTPWTSYFASRNTDR